MKCERCGHEVKMVIKKPPSKLWLCRKCYEEEKKERE